MWKGKIDKVTFCSIKKLKIWLYCCGYSKIDLIHEVILARYFDPQDMGLYYVSWQAKIFFVINLFKDHLLHVS